MPLSLRHAVNIIQYIPETKRKLMILWQIIKQSNQTKLKIYLITLCGLNNKSLPCDLEISSPFSSFLIFSNLFHLFDTIWDFYEALNGIWTAVKIRAKTTFLQSFVFVGLQGKSLQEVKQSNQICQFSDLYMRCQNSC